VLEADVLLLGEVLVLVAVAAGGRQVQGVDGRLLVVDAEDVMGAVAVPAIRHARILAHDAQPMDDVDLPLVGMTAAAIHAGELIFMGQLHDVGVAIGAIEVRVDAPRQLRRRNFGRIAAGALVAVQALAALDRSSAGDQAAEAEQAEHRDGGTTLPHSHHWISSLDGPLPPRSSRQCEPRGGRQ